MRAFNVVLLAFLGVALALYQHDEINHLRALLALPHIVLPRNGTAPTFAYNGTQISPNATTGTGTAPATPSPTPVTDTSCGVTVTPFTVKVGQPGGFFDGWWLKFSGDGVLFTSQENLATSFSVEGTGHLCAVGHSMTNGTPTVATVTTQQDTGSSAIWFNYATLIERLEPSLEPVSCSVGSGQLACAEGQMTSWVGCGLQLALAESAGNAVYNGLNCSSVTLTV